MYGGPSSFVYQVLPLSDLGMDTNKADLLKVYYSGYCSLGLTENLPSLLFTSLCDRGIVYKSTHLINKLIQINQSKKIYDDHFEAEYESLLINIKTYIEGNEDVKTKLQSFREYANSDLNIFNYAIRKILYLSTHDNHHKPENKELFREKFDDLYNKIFTGINLKFSHLIALINELGISVKVISIETMKVEDFNLGQEEIFVFMKYHECWYILYSIEDYLLMNADANEFNGIMQKVKTKQRENKILLEHYRPEVIKLKAKSEKVVEVTGKVLCLLHPNKTVDAIQASESPNLNIAEALEKHVCGHCNKTSINQISCGHSVCDEILQSTHINNANLCYKCQT